MVLLFLKLPNCKSIMATTISEDYTEQVQGPQLTTLRKKQQVEDRSVCVCSKDGQRTREES